MESIGDLIGQNIRARRKRLGLSQSELATASSMTVQAINRIERGKALPRGPNLEAIAEALKCNVTELYSGAVTEAETAGIDPEILEALKTADPFQIRMIRAALRLPDLTSLETRAPKVLQSKK